MLWDEDASKNDEKPWDNTRLDGNFNKNTSSTDCIFSKAELKRMAMHAQFMKNTMAELGISPMSSSVQTGSTVTIATPDNTSYIEEANKLTEYLRSNGDMMTDDKKATLQAKIDSLLGI